MKTNYTAKDMPYCDRLELEGGLFAKIESEHDCSHGAPWEECDGHGVVSEWTSRDKRPSERVLNSDRRRKRFYDIAESMRIARRDGWGMRAEWHAEFQAKHERPATKGEICAAAVECDYENLRAWCNDEWRYVVVTVTLCHEDGEEIASDCVGGVADCDNYDRDIAADLLNGLIAQYAKQAEHKAVLAD